MQNSRKKDLNYTNSSLKLSMRLKISNNLLKHPIL